MVSICRCHLGADGRQDALLEAGAFAGGALLEHQDDRALDVAAFLELRGGLGGDVPGGHDLQPAAQKMPTMSDQTPVSWWVNITHCMPLSGMCSAIAGRRRPCRAGSPRPSLDRQRPPRIPDPFVERLGRVFAQPGDEELGDFVVVHRVGVGRIGDPKLGVVLEIGRFLVPNGQAASDTARRIGQKQVVLAGNERPNPIEVVGVVGLIVESLRDGFSRGTGAVTAEFARPIQHLRQRQAQSRLHFIGHRLDLFMNQSRNQKLSGAEQVMPVRPAACSNRLVRLVARLDGHIRHQAFFLPATQVLGDGFLDALLAFQIIVVHRGEPGFLTTSIQRFLGDPLDGIQALLKHVVWTRLEVVLSPNGAADCRVAICCIRKSPRRS
jgi:hypothetical protein